LPLFLIIEHPFTSFSGRSFGDLRPRPWPSRRPAAVQQLGMPPPLRAARSLTAALDGRPADSPLTRREREIASLFARGLTNRQIAAALHISERTDENHVQHILTKLGLHTRTQIAAWNAGSNTASPQRPEPR
jgi:DNA-binding CsgD family transcriptional regulator